MINQKIKYFSAALTLLAPCVFFHTAQAARYESDNLFSSQPGDISKTLPAIQQNELLERAKRLRSHSQEVLQLLQEKKFDEAHLKLNEFIQQNPKEATYYNLKAGLEIQENKLEDAEQTLKKTLQVEKRNFPALLGLAQLALGKKDWSQVQIYAEQAVAVNKKNVEAQLLLADGVARQKDLAAAEKVLVSAQKAVEGDLDSEVKITTALGKLYVVQRKPEQFRQLVDALLKRYPNHPSALPLLAEAHVVAGQTDMAINVLTELTNKDPKDTRSRFLLVSLLSNQANKDTQMIELLNQILAVEPNNPQALILKAAQWIKLEKYQQANEIAEQLDKAFPKGVLGKMLHGDIQMAQKNYDPAISLYQSAYDTTSNTAILSSLANAIMAKGNYDDSINFLKKELSKNSNNAELLFRLTSLYQSKNDNDAAIDGYEKILSIQPDNLIAQNNLAWLYADKGNKKALALAEKAYGKAPKSIDIADTYGYVLLKLGKPQESVKILEQAVQLANSTTTEVHLHLAQAYIAASNKEQASAVLQKMTEQDNPLKEQALQLLNSLH